MKQYVIVWNDLFETTFYETIEQAKKALNEAIENGNIGTIKKYSNYMTE